MSEMFDTRRIVYLWRGESALKEHIKTWNRFKADHMFYSFYAIFLEANTRAEYEKLENRLEFEGWQQEAHMDGMGGIGRVNIWTKP